MYESYRIKNIFIEKLCNFCSQLVQLFYPSCGQFLSPYYIQGEDADI